MPAPFEQQYKEMLEGKSAIDQTIHVQRWALRSSPKVVHAETQDITLLSRMAQQIRVLTLHNTVDGESTIYRFEKDTILQFRLGPSLLGANVQLRTNFPINRTQFYRTEYQSLPWSYEEGASTEDDTAAYVNIKLTLDGSFHYSFTGSSEEIHGEGYFLVDPKIVIEERQRPQAPAADNVENRPLTPPETLSLDSIQCQTVLSKNLGDINTWRGKIEVAAKSGFNTIHFTPVSVLGASNSAYCIADHHVVNKVFNASWETLKSFVKYIRQEWGIISICDVVLNHAAKESRWVQEHTEATYNVKNSPHLRPAYMLDRAIFHLSVAIQDGKFIEHGIPKGEVLGHEQLCTVEKIFREHYVPRLRFHEFYAPNINHIVATFRDRISTSPPPTAPESTTTATLKLLYSSYRRFGATVDMNVAVDRFNIQHPDCPDETTRIEACCSALREKLTALQSEATNKSKETVETAVRNMMAGARYIRHDPHGPRLSACGSHNTLVPLYFTGPEATSPRRSLVEEESLMFSEAGCYCMAHNGWVMDHDPMDNFALPTSRSDVYTRRALIPWGDSVKLNYGNGPEHCPELWSYMKKYAELTAEIFQGIRLDNCHSTPMHVAEYIVDHARRKRENLYIVAELFTSNEKKDKIFVNHLGISSLIREADQAYNPRRLGDSILKNGGDRVGSFCQPSKRPLICAEPHALFFDQTHDNRSVLKAYSVHDLLPRAAIVSFAACGIGSTRGYDDLVPHQIDVVHDNRPYREWEDMKEIPLLRARKKLNHLHNILTKRGYTEVFVDQMTPDIVAVTRASPDSHDRYVLVAHTAFSNDADPLNTSNPQKLVVEGEIKRVELEARLVPCQDDRHPKAIIEDFSRDPKVINGVAGFTLDMAEDIPIRESKLGRVIPRHSDSADGSADDTHVTVLLDRFPPGSVIVIWFVMKDQQSIASRELRILHQHLKVNPEVAKIVDELSLVDIQHVLFMCGSEEEDSSNGKCGVYHVPDYGALKYAGLQGVMSILSEIRPHNDIGSCLPANLMRGNWMMDYIVGRLRRNGNTSKLGDWLESKPFSYIKQLPRLLVPKYFDAIVSELFIVLLIRTRSLMSPFVRCGSPFCQALAMGSVQHMAVVKSAPLPKLSESLEPPKPKIVDGFQMAPTMAAGLPHFSVGYMRSWGRDTFIALRGMLILTGRYEEARYLILGYAACLRDGLIPNLLDGGHNARFNCRDAIWWWLHSIISYVDEVPDGYRILRDQVARYYPRDYPAKVGTYNTELESVILEALETHYSGHKFREHRAGPAIDQHMTDEGFEVEIGVDEKGFVFGGNAKNCGTWMDKMGSSIKAGNKGRPATPRDGSAVEIVGLSYEALKKLTLYHSKGLFSFNKVQKASADGGVTECTFAEWANMIRENFETYFYISPDSPQLDPKPHLINKVDIYKDTLNSRIDYGDYQLRCNFPIAMAVAPDLFSARRAWSALQQVKSRLLGPLGIKTLDPEDMAFRGCYNLDNDSTDGSVAQGFNYHQGPEWVWPVGFFLRAYLTFAIRSGAEENNEKERYKEAKSFVMSCLGTHFKEIQTSHWRGLPELTNAEGVECPFGNPTQAWSMATVLEVLHELEKNKGILNAD